jgi:DNA-binding beta-propeller fold protein YncE
MHSLRFPLGVALALGLMTGGAYQPVIAEKPKAALTFTKLWTYGPATPGQVSEIAAFDPRTNTIWVVGIVGVDVVNADTGTLVKHIDVTPVGAVNSVAIHNGLAALAVEAKSFSTATCSNCDRRDPGKVLFYDTKTLLPSGDPVAVGSLPDMLIFTHDGSKLLVANEATPNVAADANYALVDPEGSVSIIDMETRTVTTASPLGAPTSGSFLRLPAATGMDYEPEYIAVNHDDTKAYVTLQEANAIAVLDLATKQFTEVVGLGAKDFNEPGNEIDPRDDTPASVSFQRYAVKGLYMPDSVATYQWHGETYLVMANEGDFREDNADRVAAGTAVGGVPGAAPPLDRLRVVRDLRTTGLFAAGARSFSIRRTDGEIVYDSGSILDREANQRLIYDDGRSRDKGVEPEGVALMKIGSRTFAFIGLERTTKSAVAVFDITDLDDVRFLDMIVTDGNLSPEGLAAYKYQGNYYLAIANEVVAPGQTTANTTLYLIESEQLDDSSE